MGKIILCDLDSILADIMTPWLDSYNRDYQDTLTVDKVHSWAFHDVVKPECGTKIYDYLRQPGFFENLKPLPGAIEAVQALRSAGHDFMIVTAGAAADHVPAQKIRWCKKYLDLPLDNVIVTPRKELVRGDVLIDDSPEQVRRYRVSWPTAEILSIAYPYNACVQDLCYRAYGWADTVQAWRHIVLWIGRAEQSSCVMTVTPV